MFSHWPIRPSRDLIHASRRVPPSITCPSISTYSSQILHSHRFFLRRRSVTSASFTSTMTTDPATAPTSPPSQARQDHQRRRHHDSGPAPAPRQEALRQGPLAHPRQRLRRRLRPLRRQGHHRPRAGQGPRLHGHQHRLPSRDLWPHRPRSGLASKNFIDTGAGVIDADYRGEVKVLLFNHAEADFEIKEGDRIAQLVLERIYTPDVVEVQELEESVRGAGGFGSTGSA
uniref:Deoxyuridine 5'-triphosphate nucleotidohydrolase n=1 Tax=Bionectria ochroleuca TaxID=29856 RepID=A0A8H7TNT4_BIOOC